MLELSCEPEVPELVPLWLPAAPVPLELDGVELLLFVTELELLPGLPSELVSRDDMLLLEPPL